MFFGVRSDRRKPDNGKGVFIRIINGEVVVIRNTFEEVMGSPRQSAEWRDAANKIMKILNRA